jgi:hypothetical protein
VLDEDRASERGAVTIGRIEGGPLEYSRAFAHIRMITSGRQTHSERTIMDRRTFITAISGISSTDTSGCLERLEMWYEDGKICGLRICARGRPTVMLGRRALCACLGYRTHRQLDHTTKMAKCDDLNTVLASYLASAAHNEVGGDVEGVTVFHAGGRVIGVEIWPQGRGSIVLGRRSLRKPVKTCLLVLDALHFEMSDGRLTLARKC